jgi:hypothetical protein
MSANRSVAAAQRRRAGPPEPAPPGRGPQPSINSSQMFANQQRSGTGTPSSAGQNIPNGRLAGQHAAMSQKQMMSQKQQELYQEPQSGLNGINKMTLAQAITLITLRLGKVETQLLNVGSQSSYNMNSGDDDNVLVDKNVITSLISRIDVLEKKQGTTTSTGSNPDINLLKQQFETIKPLVVQSKNSSAVFKQQIDALKTDLAETKELIFALQNLTMDNNNKIIAFNSIFNPDASEEFIDNTGLNDEFSDQNVLDQSQSVVDDSVEENDLSDNNGTSFTNLKELIEQELNA